MREEHRTFRGRSGRFYPVSCESNGLLKWEIERTKLVKTYGEFCNLFQAHATCLGCVVKRASIKTLNMRKRNMNKAVLCSFLMIKPFVGK